MIGSALKKCIASCPELEKINIGEEIILYVNLSVNMRFLESLLKYKVQ